jgi:hypothetical protein
MTTKGLTNFKIYSKKQSGFSTSSSSDTFHRTIIQEDPNDKSNLITFRDRYIFVKKIKTSIILPPIKSVVGRVYTIINQIELEDDKTIPNITVDLNEILDTIVKLTVNLISSGNNITEVGVEYKNMTTNITDTVLTTSINFPIEFTIPNLQSDTNYECFVYAINNIGTQKVYSNFKTDISPSAPVFTFEHLSDSLLDTSCQLKIDLVSDGRSKINSVSIFYGYSNDNLFMRDDILAEYFYSSSPSYLHTLHNLDEGTLYYYKLIASNDVGTFEEIKSFTTLEKVEITAIVKKVSPTNILIDLNIVKGVVSTSSINVYYGNKTLNIEVIENQRLYHIFIPYLNADTFYNINIEVTNKINVSSIYLIQKTNVRSPPQITSELIDVDTNSAIIRVNIESDGGSDLESVKLLLGSDPSQLLISIDGDLPINSSYTDIHIFSLVKGRKYFYKAIVTNNDPSQEGISEGHFSTLSEPDMNTKIIEIGTNHIIIQLEVISTGGSEITSMNIKYKNDNEEVYKNQPITDFNNPRIILSELQPNINYTIISSISNIIGTSTKTDTVTIPNNIVNPIISSNVLLETSRAIIDIIILSEGSSPVIEMGIEYGLSEDNLEYSQIIYNSTKFYLENLTENTTYYYRMYARNTEGMTEIFSNFFMTITIVDPLINDIQTPSIADPFINMYFMNDIPTVIDPFINDIQSVILEPESNNVESESNNVESESNNVDIENNNVDIEINNVDIEINNVESENNNIETSPFIINEIINIAPIEKQITEISVIANEGDRIISTLESVINRDVGKSFFAQQVKNSDGTVRYFWSVINI